MLGSRHGTRDQSRARPEADVAHTRPGCAGVSPAVPWRPVADPDLDALFVSTLAVAVAEIGDKTQLLALLLAARYRRPWPILAGILVATLLNHALAAWFGAALSEWIPETLLKVLVAASFVAVALWTLRPDRLDESEQPRPRGGAFVATTVAFFLAEIGDKTQVATVLLAVRFDALGPVIAGTTAGMLLANLPVVLLGARFAERLPLRAARVAAAILFLILAVWVAIRGIG